MVNDADCGAEHRPANARGGLGRPGKRGCLFLAATLLLLFCAGRWYTQRLSPLEEQLVDRWSWTNPSDPTSYVELNLRQDRGLTIRWIDDRGPVGQTWTGRWKADEGVIMLRIDPVRGVLQRWQSGEPWPFGDVISEWEIVSVQPGHLRERDADGSVRDYYRRN